MSLLLLAIVRIYWLVDPAVFATVGNAHTHIEISGFVSYVKLEKDGDLHFRVVPERGVNKPFVVAECIPAIRCVAPVVGDHVRVRGISRRDGEHKWWELHPVETIEVLP